MSPDPVAPTTPCPKCAVAVPLGYPRCPRCHAPIPTSPQRARRDSAMREHLIAGGTALPQAEGGGFPWLLAGVCAIAATTAAVWYATRGGRAGDGSAAAASSTPAVADPGPGGPGGAAGVAGAGGDVEPPPSPTVDPRPRQRTEAMAALEHQLEGDKLWAQVAAAGDAVVIRSAFCGDKGLGARANAAAGGLAKLGFKQLQCVEQSGAPVWRRDLP